VLYRGKSPHPNLLLQEKETALRKAVASSLMFSSSKFNTSSPEGEDRGEVYFRR
jgi:hypothetical protein